MKKLAVALCFLLLAGCATSPSDNYRSEIVGTWMGGYTSGWLSFGEKTYFKDGTACGVILTGPDGDDGPMLTTYRSEWRIKNGRLISTVIDVSPDPYLKPGDVAVDKIVSINGHYMRLEAVPSGDRYYRYRVLTNPGETLCRLGAPPHDGARE